MQLLRVLLFVIIATVTCLGQDNEQVSGFYFGPKLGPTIGLQQWDGFERRPMLNFHAAAFIETVDPDFKGALYGQIGYHTRGSGINVTSNFASPFGQSFIFNNLSATLGAKKRLLTKTLMTPYYFVGIRVDYQLSNNLQEVQEQYFGTLNSLFFPFPDFVNDITYGLSFGGGVEFLGSELVQPVLEFTISPDISNQYQSIAIPNVTNPYNGQPTTLPERSIKNLTLEISLVVRFMRKVVYID